MTGGSLKSSSEGDVNSGDKKSEKGVPSMKGEPWWSLNCGERSSSTAAREGSKGCAGGKRPAGAVRVALGAVAKLWAKVAVVARASWPAPVKAEIIAAVESESDVALVLLLLLVVVVLVLLVALLAPVLPAAVVVVDIAVVDASVLVLAVLLAVMFMY
jgi:hypothetical protein